MKPTVNKLVIDKSTGPKEIDHTTYYFKWYNDDTIVSISKMWIFYNDVPMEPYDVDAMIAQRKVCCFTVVEPITIEVI
jgi:hypothetical protein